MTRLRSKLLVALGVLALALPAAAIAGQGDHGSNHGNHGKRKGHSKKHNVGWVFKGHYAGDSTVAVERGNSRVRKGGYIGETVEFDLSGARFVLRDENGDHKRTIEDVQEGDWVLVKCRLPRKDPGSEPFEAKRLIDKTSFRRAQNPPAPPQP
jgi:hypothetical protein